MCPAARAAAGARPGWHRQLGAELRLAAGPLGEQHQPAGHLEGQRPPWSSSTSARARSMPAVTPAEVHTGRRARRCDRAAPRHRGGGGPAGARGPVGRGPVAVEQPGRGEQEGAAAHRRDPAAAGRPPEPGEQRGVGQRPAVPSPPATTSVSIGPSARGEGLAVTRPRPDEVRNDAGPAGYHRRRVGRGGGGGWPPRTPPAGRSRPATARPDDDDHDTPGAGAIAGAHGAIVAAPAGWQQGRTFDDSCHDPGRARGEEGPCGDG